MPRQRKENTPVSFRMDKATHDKLVKHCEKTGQSKTVAMERAIELYVKEYKKIK